MLSLTLAEALTIPPLNRCAVVAGNSGLTRHIKSINSFDAPDVINWLKADELVLTTGYVFKDKFYLVTLVQELAKRRCCGLAIKLSDLPDTVLETANELNFPLIKIPEDLSISDMLFPILKQVFAYQKQQTEQIERDSFLQRLIHGELNSEEAVLGEGRVFGLLPGEGYTCLCITSTPWNLESISIPNSPSLTKKIESIGETLDVRLFAGEFENKMVVILQPGNHRDATQMRNTTLKVANNLIDLWQNELPKNRVNIGIGTYKTKIQQFPLSYREAWEAIGIGKKVDPKQRIYECAAMQTYTALRHIPIEVSNIFITKMLDPLIKYDQETNSDLIKTLEIYLDCCLRPAETARKLGVHRNTIHFRIARIKELLGINLDNGEDLFQLNLAIRLSHLLNSQSR